MNNPATRKQNRRLELVNEVDVLNEEVKSLALNLAIYLAKAKTDNKSKKLNKLEPDFIRLVNGTVKAVQDLTSILNAAKNQETMLFEPPSGRVNRDNIEEKLKNILLQCNQILEAMNVTE